MNVALLWVIEDDASIGNGLVRALESEGHDVRLARSLEEAGELAGPPDLVLLDLGFPDGDGADWCREFTTKCPATRVIMVTARDTEMDIVAGLNAGAIDYLTKPFGLAELIARVRAQLRQTSTGGVPDVLTAGDLRIEIRARRVWVLDAEVELRAKEFDLLARLAEEAGQVVRREDLMKDVWDIHWAGSSKTLDVHIASLRRRLGDVAGQPSRISTLRHIGYRLEA